MYTLARELKSDSLMYLTFRAIGNRFTTKTDYNFGLENYFDALNYAGTNTIKSGLYQNIAYVYAVTENTEVALGYLRKGDALGVTNHFFPKPFVWHGVQQSSKAGLRLVLFKEM